MKLLFYGRLADVLGREMEIDTPATCTIAQLRSQLVGEHCHARELFDDKRVRACVAGKIVDNEYLARDSDVVEFLPPVSGG